ncbi:hypothetical protein [Paraburkholderia sp. RL17-373-BIF-A]|uniref:hypothetical protein n=1 Tax=Paraburkholderia sp. RL17-373-BIF-A TaxID=3031629 RepID=UPI0038BC029C
MAEPAWFILGQYALEATSNSPQSGERFDWPYAGQLSCSMEDDGPLYSPLSQRLARDRTAVEIKIYDDGEGGWLLEIVDEFGNSTVWDEVFPTDRAALAEALNTIDNDGIASMIRSAPAGFTRH